MKEITRRLYTKPVMFGVVFLAGVGLMVALFFTSKGNAAQSTFIQHGDDEFETTGNGETYHNFQASPIPANFFGPGSNQYTGVVPVEGVPINPGVSDIDTVIHRNQDVWTPGSTTLTMTALNLKSINSITVTYAGGGSEAWNVRVNLSDVKTSTGSMTIGSGGTFDSSLKVWPKFTFTRVSDGKTLVLDTGGSGLTASSMTKSAAIAIEPGPAPAPTVAPAPCQAVISDTEPIGKVGNGGFATAAASSGCAPVTLTSTNSPWVICNGGGFCIPRPLTEAELLASHNISPKGTKKQQQAAAE